MCRLVVPQTKKQNGGSIVFVVPNGTILGHEFAAGFADGEGGLFVADDTAEFGVDASRARSAGFFERYISSPSTTRISSQS
ncbi:MAG: hypothetical protein WAV18_32090, partial [Roseiarcus sp.]